MRRNSAIQLIVSSHLNHCPYQNALTQMLDANQEFLEQVGVFGEEMKKVRFLLRKRLSTYDKYCRDIVEMDPSQYEPDILDERDLQIANLIIGEDVNRIAINETNLFRSEETDEMILALKRRHTKLNLRVIEIYRRGKFGPELYLPGEDSPYTDLRYLKSLSLKETRIWFHVELTQEEVELPRRMNIKQNRAF